MPTCDGVIHGPMWQFECRSCWSMGDAFDTEAEALAEMAAHDCPACLPEFDRLVGSLRTQLFLNADPKAVLARIESVLDDLRNGPA